MTDQDDFIHRTSPNIGVPDDLALPQATREEIRFLIRSHTLTGVGRLNHLISGERPESSAEHSWHLALMALVLAPRVPGINIGRVLSMLIIHDIVEVVTGDVVIFDEQARMEIRAAERKAAEELFGLLPDPVGTDLAELWSEFEAGVTPDARFARAIDRLQPTMIHWAGDGAPWASRGVRVDQERHIAETVKRFQPEFAHLAEALVDDAVTRSLLLPAQGTQRSAQQG